MAAPLAAYLHLGDDSAFTGKKLHAQSRTVGSDTVYERAVVLDRKAAVLGIYEGNLAQQTILLSAQDGISSGFLWLHMPTAVSGCSARIRRVLATTQHSSALITLTAPRIAMTRFTFTGTATGATVTPDPDTSYRRAKADLRTASTGLTVTLVAPLDVAPVCGALTAVEAYAPCAYSTRGPLFDSDNMAPREDEFWVIAPGEGVVFWQDTGGTTADTRKLNLQVVFDEIDTA